MYTLGKVPRSLLVQPQGGIMPNGAGGRRHSINRELVDTGYVGTTRRHFRVRTPSARLRLFVSVAFEPRDGSDTAGDLNPPSAGGACWGATAWHRDALTGKPGKMNLLWPFTEDANGVLLSSSRALPDGYEADSSISEIHFNCNLGSSMPETGLWSAQATWEANEEMSTAELVELINQCALDVEGSPTLFN